MNKFEVETLQFASTTPFFGLLDMRVVPMCASTSKGQIPIFVYRFHLVATPSA